MSGALIFWLSSIILVGLQLCIPETISDANGTYKDRLAEKFWTNNYALRRFYGLSYLIGILLVVISVGYLTFAEHWWYILAYIGAILGSKLCAFIIKLGIVLIHYLDRYDRLRVCRILGSLIICTTIIASIIIISV